MLEEFNEQSENIAGHLGKSTNDLVRCLARDQDSMIYLTQHLGENRSVPILELVNILIDLRKLILTKLMTPIEEERSREHEVAEISSKLEKAKGEETLWEQKLNQARKDREKAKQSRNKEIRRLKDELT
jgi:uncharacterized protein (DUF3084 family)